MIEASKLDTSVPIALSVSKNGPATGLTAVVAIRDGSSLASYLDFADSTFKTSGWATKQAALTEIAGVGVYALSGGLDATAITNFPAGVDTFFAEFDVTGSIKAIAQEGIYFRDALVAENQSGLGTLVGQATLAVDIAGVQSDTDDLQARLPAALVGGRIDADVGSMQTDTLDAAALAADAVSELVDSTWDEALAGHLAAGTTGKALSDAGATADPAVIADAVWDESAAAHVSVGSFGQLMEIVKSLSARTNSVIDGGPGTPDVVTNTTGFTEGARIRIFSSGAAADAATKGAADGADGEIFRGTWTGAALPSAVHRLTSLTGRET